MKVTTIVGVVLIAIGLYGFMAGGFNLRRMKRDFDLGRLQVRHSQRERVRIPPVASAIAIVGGAAMLIAGSRR